MITDKTTRGLDTARLRQPKQITAVPFLIGCFLLAAAGFFFVATLRDAKPTPKLDTSYRTATELYVEHETKATKELLKQESAKVKKNSRTKFAFE